MVISEAVRRARWVEAETIHLKRMGLSFDKIADRITRIGRGQAQAMVAMPEPITFPPDYEITRQACHKAYRKASAREPALELEELRKLDNDRSEEMFMNLQPAIRKGHARAIDTGIKLLDHSARINGYAAPQRHVLSGRGGNSVTVNKKLDQVELESKVNLLRDAIQVLRDLGVPGVIEPDEPLPTDPSEHVEEPLPSCEINLPLRSSEAGK